MRISFLRKKTIFYIAVYLSLLFIIASLTLIVLNVSFEKTRLIFVIIVSRHGIRSPVRVIPNDYYDEKFWLNFSGGFSKLTKKGMEQEFEFGKFIKNYYDEKFLRSSIYKDSKNLFIRCTDYDRSYCSAQQLLNGFCHKNSSRILDLDEFYCLINKIHPLNDTIFHQSRQCPKYDYLLNQKLISKSHLKIEAKNEKLVNFFSNVSGLKIQNFFQLSKLADTVQSEEANNLKLTDWANKYKFDLLKARNYNFYLRYGTFDMARLISGPILNEIKNKLNQKINNNFNHSIALYMTHDSYLCALITLLNSPCKIQPNFASAIILELREDSNHNYYVQILFKNNNAYEPIFLNKINIKNCPKLCPLEKFFTLIEPYIIENIEKECQL